MAPQGSSGHANQDAPSGVSIILSKIYTILKSYFIFVGILVTLFMALVISQSQKMMEMDRTPGEQVTLTGDEDLFLTYKLAGTIKESSPDKKVLELFLEQLTGKISGPYLPDVKVWFERVANDSRVKGISLDISGLTGSLASFTELRSIIENFRMTSGKPVISWLYHGNNHNFFLASVSDKVYLAPVGDVTMPGPGIDQVYLGDAIRKIGVDIEVVRSGKFKAAFEPLVRNKPSEASVEMYHALTGSLETFLSEKISQGRSNETRQIDVDTVKGWFKRGLFTPQDAVREGLVDGLMYYDQIPDSVDLADKPKPRVIEFEKYLTASGDLVPDTLESVQDGIALIEAQGEIHLSQKDDEESITPENIGQKLDWALKSSKVKAVVLRISSPGGSAIAADLIWKKVSDLAAKKPLIVSMGSVAASGGYYIAAPALKIFANPTTITGSIGVIGMVPNFSSFEEKYGVSFHSFSNSDRIGLLSPGKKMNEQDKALLAESIDHVYKIFIEKVASGRSMDVDAVHKVAQGRVWTGSQAIEIGLADQSGGLSDAIQAAWIAAGFQDGHKPVIHRWSPNTGFSMKCLIDYRQCFPGVAVSKLIRGQFSNGLAETLRKADVFGQYVLDEPVQAVWTGVAP